MRISDWSSDVCSSDLEYLSVQRTNRSSIGDFVKSLPPDYRAPPHGLTLPVPAAMPPGGLQRKTCRPIQQRRHERHELVERAGVFRPLADDLVVDGENDRLACAIDPYHAGRPAVAAAAGRDVLGGESAGARSDERRVGKGGVRKCRS